MEKILIVIRKFLFFCIVSGIILYGIVAFYVGTHVYMNDAKKSDVIIVLGARSYLDGRYNPCLVERVRQGTSLYKGKMAPSMIVSGGKDEEDESIEAEVMKDIAQKLGMPEKHIIRETQSTSTYENLLYSQKIMKQKGFTSAIVVSEPFHTPRAALVARKLGMHVTVSPATSSICWTRGKWRSHYFLKEPLAIILYFLQGKI